MSDSYKMTLGSSNFAIPHHHHFANHLSHANSLAESAAAISAFNAANSVHSWNYAGSYGAAASGPPVSCQSTPLEAYPGYLGNNPYFEERSRHLAGGMTNPCAMMPDPFRDFSHQVAAAAVNAASAMQPANMFYAPSNGEILYQFIH